MKKIVLLLPLCFVAICLNAQTDSSELTVPKIPATLIMPDGKVIPTASLDSVQKVNGWDGVVLSFLDDGVHIHPQKTKTEQIKSEERLNAHLNKPAPAFTLKDLEGMPVSLGALNGKIVVLNFWFTQCGGCIAEMAELNRLKQSYAGKDVVFLAITFDDSARINAFLSKKTFEYTLIPSAKKTCVDYDIYGYPTSMVIDQQGVVRFINCSLDRDIKSQLSHAIMQLMPM